jgi:hypothetical protein
MPRANVSVINMAGNLYAIGGFSGKKFLNTIEVLAADAHEWCCYQPATRVRKARIGAGNANGECSIMVVVWMFFFCPAVCRSDLGPGVPLGCFGACRHSELHAAWGSQAAAVSEDFGRLLI